jgi:hypothetical protein
MRCPPDCRVCHPGPLEGDVLRKKDVREMQADDTDEHNEQNLAGARELVSTCTKHQNITTWPEQPAALGNKKILG